jgi:hypothetical protein
MFWKKKNKPMSKNDAKFVFNAPKKKNETLIAK